MKEVGCEHIFIEKATGAHVQRTELTRCLKTLAVGDTLIVRKLDRLGRSLRDLIGLLDDIKARGVAFRSLTEAIDTATPTGRLATVTRGVKMGRKPKLSSQFKQGEHYNTVAQSLNVLRLALYQS